VIHSGPRLFTLFIALSLALIAPSLQGTEEGHPIEVLFSPNGGIKAKLAKLVQTASSSIDIATNNIFLPEVSLSLLGAKKRGVRIRIITDAYTVRSERSDIPLFQRNGIEVFQTNGSEMKHSFAIFDSKRIATGSYEWTDVGEFQQSSSILFTENPDLLKAFNEQFKKLWSKG
jgi:mitochondrial cardiolipin hydrolase